VFVGVLYESFLYQCSVHCRRYDFKVIHPRRAVDDIYIYIYIYRVSQEERAKLREGVPCVKLYRYNPKHLYPELNGYEDNGQRSLKL